MEQDRTHSVVQVINDHLDAQGVSKTELARRLGWERMTVVRRLATGKYSTDLTIPELEQIAAALGVPVSQLLPADSPATAGAGAPGNGASVPTGGRAGGEQAPEYRGTTGTEAGAR